MSLDDLIKAWALANLAIERGDEEAAKKILGELSPRLTPELLAEAEKELEKIKSPKPEIAPKATPGEEPKKVTE